MATLISDDLFIAGVQSVEDVAANSNLYQSNVYLSTDGEKDMG